MFRHYLNVFVVSFGHIMLEVCYSASLIFEGVALFHLCPQAFRKHATIWKKWMQRTNRRRWAWMPLEYCHWWKGWTVPGFSRACVWQPASLCWWRLCLHREPSGVPEEPASVPADETDHPAEPGPPTSPSAAARQRQPTAAAANHPAPGAFCADAEWATRWWHRRWGGWGPGVTPHQLHPGHPTGEGGHWEVKSPGLSWRLSHPGLLRLREEWESSC